MSVMGFVPPDRLEEARARIEGLTAGQRVLGVQTAIVRKDGTRVPVSASVSPITDDAGTIVGIAAIVRDESAREAAAAALREREEQFRSVFQLGPIGMVLVDGSRTWTRGQRRPVPDAGALPGPR